MKWLVRNYLRQAKKQELDLLSGRASAFHGDARSISERHPVTRFA